MADRNNPKLLLLAIRAFHRAEQDSFSELSFAFGHGHFCNASKRAGTRDSGDICRRLWKWGCKRWRHFPKLSYLINELLYLEATNNRELLNVYHSEIEKLTNATFNRSIY